MRTGVVRVLGSTIDPMLGDGALDAIGFRDDFPNQPYCQKNAGTAKSQHTILLGLVAFIGPKK